MDDVTLIVPHQVNIRILQAAAERLGVSMDKIYTNIDRYGNTSAASGVETRNTYAPFAAHTGGPWTFIAVLAVAFFIASAGASAAYLTVSEIFPMETRALAIAFFYAVGTAIGGITGPLLFGALIGSGQRSLVAVSFLIGAAVMAIGGKTSARWSNVLMRYRIVAQAAALVIIALVAYFWSQQ